MERVDLEGVLTGIDPEPSYLVDELICKGQVLLVAGDPGVGKSFLMYYIGMSLASGLSVLGKAANATRVLYFDEENSRLDMSQYLRWIWRGLAQPSVEVLQDRLYIEQFSLSKRSSKRWEYMAECAKLVQPGLIIVDTVSPCAAIEDENDNGEASRAMRQFRMVRNAAGPDCSMILLKHAKFSHDPHQKQTIRGAKAWLGEADGTIFHRLTVGAKRSDGLRNSRLTPDKVRAFGLRKELLIVPQWCGEGKEKGVVLHG